MGFCIASSFFTVYKNYRRFLHKFHLTTAVICCRTAQHYCFSTSIQSCEPIVTNTGLLSGFMLLGLLNCCIQKLSCLLECLTCRSQLVILRVRFLTATRSSGCRLVLLAVWSMDPFCSWFVMIFPIWTKLSISRKRCLAYITSSCFTEVPSMSLVPTSGTSNNLLFSTTFILFWAYYIHLVGTYGTIWSFYNPIWILVWSQEG